MALKDEEDADLSTSLDSLALTHTISQIERLRLSAAEETPGSPFV